jgi:hypothetical protein
LIVPAFIISQAKRSGTSPNTHFDRNCVGQVIMLEEYAHFNLTRRAFVSDHSISFFGLALLKVGLI